MTVRVVPARTVAIMDLGLIFLLVMLNGLFAFSEIAIVASRPARLQQLHETGHQGAAAALALHRDPSRFLSTVQVGITAVGVLSGALGESLVADPVSNWAAQYPAFAPKAATIGLLVAVALITYLSVVFGELVPKRLALVAPERIALAIARPMEWLSRLARPLVWVLSRSGDAVLALVPVRRDRGPPVTDEEIAVLMAQGAEAGIFHEAEQAMVSNVLRLDERRVTSIMTPRPELQSIDLDDSDEQIRDRLVQASRHRLLVCRGGPDNVIGTVETPVLLADLLANRPLDVAARTRMPLVVPESVTTTSLLASLRDQRAQHALVTDEYGDVQGLVTNSDLLAAIVGGVGIVEGEDAASIVRRDATSWLVDGSLAIEQLQDTLQLGPLPGQDTHEFTTVAGFVLHRMGRIPKAAEHFTWNDLRFEVVDMDGRRVDKVLVSRVGDGDRSPPAE